MIRRHYITIVAVAAVVALLIAATALFAANAKGIEWQTDFDKAVKLAQKQAKPLMIDFYADWCPPCRKLNSDTFTNPKVVTLSRKFVCVKVDVDKHGNLASKYGVESIPNIVFLDSKAKEVHRSIGYMDADEFVKVMNQALKKAK